MHYDSLEQVYGIDNTDPTRRVSDVHIGDEMASAVLEVRLRLGSGSTRFDERGAVLDLVDAVRCYENNLPRDQLPELQQVRYFSHGEEPFRQLDRITIRLHRENANHYRFFLAEADEEYAQCELVRVSGSVSFTERNI